MSEGASKGPGGGPIIFPSATGPGIIVFDEGEGKRVLPDNEVLDARFKGRKLKKPTDGEVGFLIDGRRGAVNIVRAADLTTPDFWDCRPSADMLEEHVPFEPSGSSACSVGFQGERMRPRARAKRRER